jgi:pilus assembly protein CpaC
VISTQASSQRVKLGLNKSIVIDLPRDAYDILVSNPSVADAVTRTSRRIYLFGKQVGETNIFVFGPNGEQIASLDLVVERDVAGLEAHLARFVPNSDISVELVNDNVVLTGTVRTPQDAQNAARLAEAFVSGGEATTGQYAQTAAGHRWRRRQHQQSRRPAPQQPHRQPDLHRRRRPGHAQGDRRRVSRNVMKQLGVNLIGQANGIRIQHVDAEWHPRPRQADLHRGRNGGGGSTSCRPICGDGAGRASCARLPNRR